MKYYRPWINPINGFAIVALLVAGVVAAGGAKPIAANDPIKTGTWNIYSEEGKLLYSEVRGAATRQHVFYKNGKQIKMHCHYYMEQPQ